MARTAAANFLLVKDIILSPELSIHGKEYPKYRQAAYLKSVPVKAGRAGVT
jgi:hypothetical protein